MAEILSGKNARAWVSITDKNNLDKSYKLAKNFLDFPLWEKRIAYSK